MLAFDPVWLQMIATFVPLYYGRHALEMAILYHSSDQLGRDVAVLAGSALLTVGLGTLAMRRGLVQSYSLPGYIREILRQRTAKRLTLAPEGPARPQKDVDSIVWRRCSSGSYSSGAHFVQIR